MKKFKINVQGHGCILLCLILYKSELLNQRMFPVVHPGEVQEFLHIVTDVFPLFPYDSDFYADGWTEGNSFYARRGKFISHAGIEKATILAGLY